MCVCVARSHSLTILHLIESSQVSVRTQSSANDKDMYLVKCGCDHKDILLINISDRTICMRTPDDNDDIEWRSFFFYEKKVHKKVKSIKHLKYE